MFDIDGLPTDVRYCAWRNERVERGITKIPYGGVDSNGHHPIKASTIDPSTWIPLANAPTLVQFLEVLWRESGEDLPFMGGVGVFLGLLNDGRVFCGVDLDSCIGESGLEDWAVQIVDAVPGYWEISPSGTGIKLFAYIKPANVESVRAALRLSPDRDGTNFKKRAAKGSHPPGLEIYLGRRFFALTSNALGTKQICELSVASAALILSAGQALKGVKPPATERGSLAASPSMRPVGDRTAETLPGLEMLSTDPRMSGRLAALWSGDLSGLGDDRSRSAIAFRLGLEMKAVGFSDEDVVAGVMGHPLTSEWAAEKGMVNGGREMERLLGKAQPLAVFGELPMVVGLSSGDPRPKRERPQRVMSVAGEEAVERTSIADGVSDDDRGLVWLEDGGPPIIRVRVPLHEVVDLAEEAVLLSGMPIMQRGSVLVRPVMLTLKSFGGVETASAGLQQIGVDEARDILSKAARWVKRDARAKGYVACNPPVEVASTWLARAGRWRAPRVNGLITVPTLRWDGSLLCENGYDERTGLYLMPDPKLTMPAGWNRDLVVKADAEQGLRLLDGLLDEFPFVEACDRSVALSAILTLVVRGALAARPMHTLDAPEAGTGKTFLVKVLSEIVLGRSPPLATPGKTEEETEKRLGSLLLKGVPLAVLDNVMSTLGGALLCQVVTEPMVTVRILGKSEMPDVENSLSLIATGNNMVITGDLIRRNLVCKLDARTEQPETRDFTGNPLRMVRADRGRYVAAALTVARAHAMAGYPGAMGLRPLASFDDWTRMVRGALVWLGRADPVESMSRTYRGDTERNELRTVLSLWAARFGSGESGARTIREALDTFGIGGGSVGEGPGALTTLSSTVTPVFEMGVEKLGYKDFAAATQAFREVLLRIAGRNGIVDPIRVAGWFRKNEGRVVGTFRIMKCEMSNHAKVQTWMVERVNSRLKVIENETV